MTILDMFGALPPEQKISLMTLAVTVIGGVAAAIGAMIAALVRAFAYRREEKRKQWQRLQELFAVITHGKAHGHWGQLVAIAELSSVAVDKTTVRNVVDNAIDYWEKNRDPHATELVTALRAAKRNI